MKMMLLPLLLLLAACGGGDVDDFAIEIDRPVDQVTTALSGLSAGRSSGVALYRTEVVKAQDDPNSLSFKFIAPKENEHQVSTAEANIKFRLEAIEPGRTRIAVNVDIPQVPMEAAGKNMVMSEQKVIRELRATLEEYVAAVKEGREVGPALLKTDHLLAAIALGMDPQSMENVAASQWGAVDFNEMASGAGSYGPDPTYGEPMDDASPDSTTAYNDEGEWGAE